MLHPNSLSEHHRRYGPTHAPCLPSSEQCHCLWDMLLPAAVAVLSMQCQPLYPAQTIPSTITNKANPCCSINQMLYKGIYTLQSTIPKSNPLTIKEHPENSVRRYPCLLKRECSRILDRSSIISPLALGHLDLLHIVTWGVLPCTETQQLGNCPQQIHT